MSVLQPDVIALVVLAVAGAAGLAVTLLADRAVRLTLGAAAPAGGARPPLSVLKPLKGMDEGLYDNLASLAAQEYPAFEILFGAADPRDPALEVARRVAADHPRMEIRVLVCQEDAGLNPKVNILAALAREARHEQVVISDSNVRAGRGYLAALAAELDRPGVGLVTNVVVGEGEATLSALFENLHLATYVARASLFARVYLRHSCVVGKSMLFRQSDLATLGGWTRVRDLLAEDYVIGRAFEQAGHLVAVCPGPIVTHNVAWTLDRFARRHLRWGQMRRQISPAGYLLETLFNPTPFLLALVALASLLGTGWSRWPLAIAALLGVAVRVAADGALMARVRGRRLPLRALLCTVPKDVLSLGLWAVAGLRRTVEWRGNVLVVGPGTRLERQGEARRRRTIRRMIRRILSGRSPRIPTRMKAA